MDRQNIVTHLREHQEYPATKEELMQTCDNLSEFGNEDKQWFMNKLPEGTYNSADEVIEALGLSEPAAT